MSLRQLWVTISICFPFLYKKSLRREQKNLTRRGSTLIDNFRMYLLVFLSFHVFSVQIFSHSRIFHLYGYIGQGSGSLSSNGWDIFREVQGGPVIRVFHRL